MNVEMNVNARVTGTINDPTLTGTARVVRDADKIRALWSPRLERWFPKGLDDPDLALLEVRIDKAEYWDEPHEENVKVSTL